MTTRFPAMAWSKSSLVNVTGIDAWARNVTDFGFPAAISSVG